MHLLVRAQRNLVWVQATSLVAFPVPLSQQVWCPNADAGLSCLDAAGLKGTLRASAPTCSISHAGAPAVPTDTTPPACFRYATCRYCLWCCWNIVSVPVPVHCHLWMVVGQIVTGAGCLASIVGAFGSICATCYDSLPPVRLPSLARAAAPPDLPVALRSDGDAAQVGVGVMVPLLLQVRSQLANIGASLLIMFACKHSRCCGAVLWQGTVLKNSSAALGECARLECYC